MSTLLSLLFAYSLNRKPTVKPFLVVAVETLSTSPPQPFPPAPLPLSLPSLLFSLQNSPFPVERSNAASSTQIAADALMSDLTNARLAGAPLFTNSAQSVETHLICLTDKNRALVQLQQQFHLMSMFAIWFKYDSLGFDGLARLFLQPLCDGLKHTLICLW